MKRFFVIGLRLEDLKILGLKRDENRLIRQLLGKNSGIAVPVRFSDGEKTKGMVGHYEKELWKEIAAISLNAEELRGKLKGHFFSEDNCEKHFVVLPCGCLETRIYIHVSKTAVEAFPCPTCDGYYLEPKECEYVDCAEHSEFFRKHPCTHRFYMWGYIPQLGLKDWVNSS